MSDADQGLRPCPHCAEPIRPEARVCRYCGRDVVSRFAHLPSYQAGVRARERAAQPFKWTTGHTIMTGVAAAGAALIAGLYLYARTLPPPPPPAPGAGLAAATPHDFYDECAVALVEAQEKTDQLDSANVAPIDPAIIQSGYPTRVQCGLNGATIRDNGAVTFAAYCMDAMKDGCVRVTAAVMSGRVVYASQDAVDALAKAARRKR